MATVRNIDSARSATSTWKPIDLEKVFDRDVTEDIPTILARSDGNCLLYPGRLHTFIGEIESMKTWLALEAARQELDQGHRVVMIDFEDHAAGVLDRLLQLGVRLDQVLAHFAYIRPDEPLTDSNLADLLEAITADTVLVIIDGVTDGMVTDGLDPLSNKDAAKWMQRLPKRLNAAGPAVVILDHVTKAKDSRGRFAIGAQHKLAGITGVALTLETVTQLSRTAPGLSRLKVSKDRLGHVRALAAAGQLAELHVTPDGQGAIKVTLKATDQQADGGRFRPTNLMEKVSRLLEDAGEPISTVRIINAIPSKADHVRLAINALVADGYAERQAGPRNAQLHALLKPYRQPQFTWTGPGPDLSPEQVPDDLVPPGPPLQGDQVTGPGQTKRKNNPPSPDQESLPDPW
jgi:hypothetical protein